MRLKIRIDCQIEDYLLIYWEYITLIESEELMIYYYHLHKGVAKKVDV